MTYIEYFKLQAKNLLKDFKSKEQKHFSDDAEYIVLCEYGYDEDDFSLMKAQHIIALMCGVEKWADLLSASETSLEVANLLFDNRDTVNIEDWKMYVLGVERDNDIVLNSESKLEILRQVWLNKDYLKESA